MNFLYLLISRLVIIMLFNANMIQTTTFKCDMDIPAVLNNFSLILLQKLHKFNLSSKFVASPISVKF